MDNNTLHNMRNSPLCTGDYKFKMCLIPVHAYLTLVHVQGTLNPVHVYLNPVHADPRTFNPNVTQI